MRVSRRSPGPADRHASEEAGFVSGLRWPAPCLRPKAEPWSLAGWDFPNNPSASTSRLRGGQCPGFCSSGRSFGRSAACAGLSASVSSIRQVLRFGLRSRAGFGIGSARLRRLPGSPRRLRIALIP